MPIATRTSVLILPARPPSVTVNVGRVVLEPFVTTRISDAFDQPSPPLLIVIVEIVFHAGFVEYACSVFCELAIVNEAFTFAPLPGCADKSVSRRYPAALIPEPFTAEIDETGPVPYLTETQPACVGCCVRPSVALSSVAETPITLP